MRTFLDGFTNSFADMHPKAISREFYSDYVTPPDDDIHQDGTTIHVVHALRMVPKGRHERRLRRHFRNPDRMRFDMQHGGWRFGSRWTAAALATIDERKGVA